MILSLPLFITEARVVVESSIMVASGNNQKVDCDPYKALNLPSHAATDDEIKRSYRQLAKKYHPDTNKEDKSAQKKFQEVSEVK